jgi:hypothetical protein
VRLECIAIEQARRAVVILVVQFVDPLREFLQVAGFGGDVHVIRTVIAVDAVFGDEGLSTGQRIDRHLE